ncbi:MAG: PH domain-containing protein [Anaerolineaceae bacterium]|jgi:hypothetical protein
MESTVFPHRRTGLISLIVLLILTLLGIAAVVLVQMMNLDISYPLLILAAVLLVMLLTWLLVQLYILLTMRYTISRGGIDLRWGLRRERIPLGNLQWVRSLSDFQSHLPLPFPRLPGLIFGKKKVKGLGLCEFAATKESDLVLVSTSEKVYVISPTQPLVFTGQYNQWAEIGSLEDLEALSVGGRLLWGEIWRDGKARLLIIVGALGVGLVWITALSMSFQRTEVLWPTFDTLPSDRLILLAVLSTAYWVVDLFMGVFFYRRGNVSRLLTYLLWSTSILVSLILIAAILLMSL